MMSGRPLRFLGAVVAGWTALRVVMLWPADLPAPLGAAPALAEAPPAATRASGLTSLGVPVEAAPKAAAMASRAAQSAEAEVRAAPGPTRLDLAAVTVREAGAPSAASATPRVVAPEAGERLGGSPIVERATGRPRLAADSWLVLRPGGGDSLAFGQLGASQGGARLTYALDEGRRLALSARVSAPLHGSGREAGIGVDLRPTRLPVHLLVEERFGFDGRGARPAAGVIAGGSAALPGRARLDAYGQGGAVFKRGGFVDGAALATRPVLERGVARVELGGGAWGAAQRRVARLDLGPSIALVAPVGGRAIRLQLDYRVLVAGRARPGSGPALTLGGGF